MGTGRLLCLVGKHQWHNDWDEDKHEVYWVCKRCRLIKSNRPWPIGDAGSSGGGGSGAV